MNHPDMVRIVYDYQPYLAVRRANGSLERAFGPFAPAAEPSVAESSAGEVHDPRRLGHAQKPVAAQSVATCGRYAGR